jgi:Uma2 family endonuclease
MPWFVTRDEYHRLHELDFFHDRRVERIYGRVMIMSPVGWKHVLCKSRVAEVLRSAFGPVYFVLEQDPLPIEEHSDPQPDVAVYRGSLMDIDDHPGHALMVVEVADTTLKRDTGEKARLYAASGIADYWVIDIQNRQARIFRKPAPDSSSESGFSYTSFDQLPETARVSPLALPDVTIRIADLLPRNPQ